MSPTCRNKPPGWGDTMDDLYIVNGQVYLDGRFQNRTIHIRDGKLRLPGPEQPARGEIYDAAGRRVVPGFIDIHTHGAVGVDVNSASAADEQSAPLLVTGALMNDI